MYKSRKKLATLAVASALSGGAMMMSAPAQALNVSQNGVGEVLLFPYYTAKNNFDTMFSVTNTTDKTAIFKIRFREALNSREVRDFNVVLSPYDYWSGIITSSGAAGGAKVRTFDKSCTSPNKPDWTAVTVNGLQGYEVEFTNALFSGKYADGAPSEIARVEEGYFEVILMGVSTATSIVSSNTIDYNAKHGSGTNNTAVPRDCAAVHTAIENADYANFDEPQNILKGHVTYLNTTTGQSFDAEPTALESWADGTGNLIFPASSSQPDLASSTGGTVNSLVDGAVVSTAYADSEDGASMALAAASVINEFVTGGIASTSWIVTFPTKHHYTDSYTLADGTSTTAPTSFAPFSYRFVGDTDGTGRSCDKVRFDMFDREEAKETTVESGKFSPLPPTDTTVSLCYEANVVDFGTSKVFGNGSFTDYNNHLTAPVGVGDSGWTKLSFIGTNALVGLNGYVGLPVIGFAAVLRSNTSQADNVRNYGANITHAYQKRITN